MPDIGDLEAAIEAAHREAAGDEPVITHEPATNRPAPVAKPAANKPASAPIPAVQEPATKPAGDKGPDGTAATVTGIPALTLDNALEEKRKEAAKKLDKAAQELGKAESLKDLTDTMAETLFGDASFEAIAADVVANPPPGMTAPGKPKEEASPVMLELEEDQSPVELESGTDCEPAKANKPASPAAGPREMGQTGNFDMTMSKRMDMLKKLNSAAKPAKGATLEKIEIGDDRAAPKTPKPATSQPAPIEQQIKTEITMTVKAISDVDLPPEDDSEDRKGKGLFSRFKRSS